MFKNKKIFKHQLLLTAISVFMIVFTMIGGSYAIFSSTSTAGEYNVIKAGTLEISYVDTGDGYGDVLSLNGAYPISDSEGIKLEPYRFNITNTGSIAADFKIKILYDEAIIKEDNCENNLLLQQYVKIKIDNEEPILLSSKENENYTIYSGTNLMPGSSENHNIRIWIDENAGNASLGKHFHGKVVVESIQSGVDSSLTKEYAIGQAITLKDDSKWHVLKISNSTTDMVTLLSDYNLNTDGSYNTSCSSNICSPQAFDKENNRLTLENSYCVKPENGCNIYIKNGTTVLKNSSIKEWLDSTYAPLLKQSLTLNGGNLEDLVITIPSMEDIATSDGKIFNQNELSLTKAWLKTTSYWTKTPSNLNTSDVWCITNSGKNELKQANNSTEIGVRPMITISKTNIK